MVVNVISEKWRQYMRKFSIRPLSRIGVIILASVMIGCISPRASCEQYRDPDSWERICILGLSGDSYDVCLQKEVAGMIAPGTCAVAERAEMLSCLEYLNRKSKCEDEINIPLIPKIVLIHGLFDNRRI